MKTRNVSARVTVSLLMMLAWCGLTRTAAAQGVKDGAGLFSDAAISKANQAIRDIKSNFGKDVYIETFKEIPPQKVADFKKANNKQRDKLFDDWALSRARTLKVDGIYVHVVKTPEYRRLDVVVNPATLKKAFTSADRDQFRELWLAKLRKGSFNDALEDSIALLQNRLEKNLGPIVAAPVVNAVRDHAGMFSKDALARSNVAVKIINNKFKVPMTVEAFSSPPARVKEAATGPKENSNKAYAAWLRERQNASKVDGIYVLLCKDPKLIRIGVGPQTEKRFTAEDRKAVFDLIAKQFSEKDFDRGLEGAVAMVGQRLAKNATPPPTPALAVNTVMDNARLFSPETVTRMNKAIKDLASRYKTDLTFETFAQPPVELMKSDKGEAAWAAARLGDANGKGLYILVVNGRVTLVPGEGSAVPAADRDRLAQMLTERIRARQPNQALEDSVQFVGDTLAALPIRDAGNFFSTDALAKGNETIRKLRQRFHRDVIVETYKTVPAELAQGVNLDDRQARDQFFTKWAKDRLKASGRDAVLVLISKQPTMLKVEAVPESKWIGAADVQALSAAFFKDLKVQQFDKALADGLAAIAGRLEGRPIARVEPIQSPKTGAPQAKIDAKPDVMDFPAKSKAAKARSEFNSMWIVYGIAILFGVIILFAIIRAIVRGSPRAQEPHYQQPPYAAQQPYPQQQYPQQQYPQQQYPQRPQQPPPGYGARPAGYPQGGYAPQQPPPPAPAQGGGGGGGGFVAGMLGGAAGAVAGNVLYDKFARGGGQQVGAAQPPPAARPPASGYDAGPPAADYGKSAASSGSSGEPDYVASGGDWSSPQETTSGGGSAGGDWGGEPAPAQDAAGGDWGDQPQETQQADTGGGDWGATDTGGGGDAGGDWGSQPASDTGASDTSDAGGGGGDWGGGDTGGGDTGGGDAGGGGDW